MYFVTCFDKRWYRAQEVFAGLKPRTDPAEQGCSRLFGYFLTREAAVEAVLENLSDIHEGIYVFCVIERLEPGFASVTKEELWFKWDSDALPAAPGVWPQGRWVALLEKPEACRGVVNFALG